MSHFGHFNLNSVLEFKVHSAWLSGKIGSAEKRYLDEACAVETIRVGVAVWLLFCSCPPPQFMMESHKCYLCVDKMESTFFHISVAAARLEHCALLL